MVCKFFFSRTNSTQKIFIIENQNVTIPVPGTEIMKPVLVAAFAINGSIPILHPLSFYKRTAL
jgi:hypothetical protein